MSAQNAPQAGSSRQGYQALQFPKLTYRRMTERPQLEAPPTGSEDADQHVEYILSRVAPSSRIYHSYGQEYSPHEIGPLGSLLLAGFTTRLRVPHIRGPSSNTFPRQ